MTSAAAAAGPQPGTNNLEEDHPDGGSKPGSNNLFFTDSSAKTFSKHHLTQKDSVLYDKSCSRNHSANDEGILNGIHALLHKDRYISRRRLKI